MVKSMHMGGGEGLKKSSLSWQSATQNNLQVDQKDKLKLLPALITHSFWTEAESLWFHFPHSRKKKKKKEHPDDLTSVRCESASLFISKSSRAGRWSRSWEVGSFVRRCWWCWLPPSAPRQLRSSVRPSVLRNGLDSKEPSRPVLCLAEVQTLASQRSALRSLLRFIDHGLRHLGSESWKRWR